MLTPSTRLERVLSAIDVYNKRDPNREMVDGNSRSRELVYSERLTHWVLKLSPEASELLRIVARGQHIGRWTSPRESYPMDRSGYLRWREELKRFHAKTVTELMAPAGYTPAEQERVRSMILKKNLNVDPEVQVVEDALCLLFLETQFDDLLKKTPEDKMIDIVRKTWKKMSKQGQEAAFELPFTGAQKALLEQALAD